MKFILILSCVLMSVAFSGGSNEGIGNEEIKRTKELERTKKMHAFVLDQI